MKTLASAMTLLLLSVIVLCPIIVCPLTAQPLSDSCCHKRPSHPAPCPTSSVPDCPYSILEKTKASSVPVLVMWPAAIIHAAPPVELPVFDRFVPHQQHVADASGLFLRNRVLLI